MLDTIVRRYRNWKSYRQAYDELMRLSNRELDELGISGSDIPSIARQSVR